MGILSRILGTEATGDRERREPTFRASSPENPSAPLSNPDGWLVDWANGGVPLFGPPVSEQTAMAVSAVFRCVTLIGGIIAGTPLKVYRDDPNKGRQESPDHKLTDLLGAVPFPGRPLTSFAWREMWFAGVGLWGNHFSLIRYDNAARVIGFEPVPPQLVEVVRLPNGRNLYFVNWPGGRREAVDQDDMLHFAGPGFDGLRAPSRIQAFARNSVAIARSLEESTGRAHDNAAKPSGMVTVPPNIKPEGLRRMEAFFNERYAGRLNTGRVLFADKDSTFTPLQMSPEDLNTIEFRRYATQDICRFYGVPPHLVGEAAGTSAWGSGIEQLTIGFLRFTLEAEFQRFEHEIKAKLFPGSQFYPRFDREALQAMDATAAAATMQTEINSGVLTINEARRKKARPDVPGGDTPLVNATMISLDRAITAPPAPAAPAAPNKEPASNAQ